ncbi:hypothetical protein H5410_051810 [Solanum commersonii]|uniref:Uncharacterized protein n=1 Tax=Solanum commersonii TaxID=4109 RepID=A0A9J5X0I4_SOLCO|nr:hypothetical protein H5410_051810 [Solanum commersonii]
MTNSESSSKLPISQEVENPSSFNFSIPLPDESPSTAVYGVGEMVESITLSNEVIASPMLSSEDILAYSPTLVLFGEKSKNSEAQSIAKPSVEPLSKEIEVGSIDVSYTMSERLFEGDLPKEKGPESCILAAGEELVAVQSLASLRGDVQPTLLEYELGSPDQVPHENQPMFDQTPRSFDVESDKEEEEEVPLKWSIKGVRGMNTFTMDVPNLETIKGTPEATLTVENVECAKERKRKAG